MRSHPNRTEALWSAYKDEPLAQEKREQISGFWASSAIAENEIAKSRFAAPFDALLNVLAGKHSGLRVGLESFDLTALEARFLMHLMAGFLSRGVEGMLSGNSGPCDGFGDKIQGVSPAGISQLWELMHGTATFQQNAIIEGQIPNPFSSRHTLKVSDTTITRHGCYMHVKTEESNFFLYSFANPIDGVLFPSEGALFTRKDIFPNAQPRTISLVDQLFKNPHRMALRWKSEFPTSHGLWIHAGRPGHNLLQEWRGYFSAQGDTSLKLRAWVSPPASFFDPSLATEDSSVTTPERWNKTLEPRVAFSRWQHLENSGGSPEFIESLRNHSAIWLRQNRHKLKLTERDSAKKGEVRIWLAITSGEKRIWEEELACLRKLISLSLNRFSRCHFVFDGWTGRREPNQIDRDMTNLHEHMRDRVMDGFGGVRWSSVIGSLPELKIQWALSCDYFISSSTPAIWPSVIGGVPGIYHGNLQALRIAKTLTNPTKVMLTDPANVREKENPNARRQGEGSHFRSYSVPIDHLVALFDDLIRQHPPRTQ